MMASLWNARNFVDAIAPLSQGGMIGDVDGISIDSRTVEQGDAFFAIKGEQFDGHEFAESAIKAGASVVILDAAQKDRFAYLSERVLFVDDVLSALQRLGIAARKRVKGKILAVTGSVGKTSTKDALRKALAPSGKVHAAVSSFNNHWGVPLTLARMPQDTDFGIFEIGMNHSGEISKLVAMVKPDLAIITTVVAAHIGNFSGIEGIAAAKAEIFEGVTQGGVALINGDNEFADFLTEKALGHGISHIHRFGHGAGSDIRLVDLALRPDGSQLEISLFGEAVTCELGAPGEHLAMNALAVLGAVDRVGGDLKKACAVLAGHEATRGRGERHQLRLADGEAVLIDESYNANPSSVSAALATLGLGGRNKGRRIAILGDMLELGDDGPTLHRDLLEPLLAAKVDEVYLSGPLMASLWRDLPIAMRGTYANSSADLVEPVMGALQDGDVVMIKGSLGSRMGVIVSALLNEFKACP